ncbi:MAG TPA: ABC transporter ATP-binding protein [Gemmatales bacterium]|nr:ABC transporter ATP-binding protein [Gemmatales bacterium]
MSAIRFQSLTIAFPPAPPHLAGVNWTLTSGRIAAVLGPSGCGKTSVLRVAAGLQSPLAGQVFVSDLPAADAAQAGHVGMVFQQPVLFPHLCVQENLAIGWELQYTPLRKSWGTERPRAEVRQRLDQVAELLELGPLLDRHPAHLSGGERQRVALGRLLVRRPAVFLLDEPFAFLDNALAQRLVRRLVPLLREWQVTALWVPHSPAEAELVADCQVHVHAGQWREAGAER